jgi:DNA-binding CsgD family transcriptional regulator
MGRKKSELSPRQREIILGLALGKTRSQVAYELSISPNTLNAHLRNAFRFLGAVNVVDAVQKLQGEPALPVSALRKAGPLARVRPLPLNVDMRVEDGQVLVTLELAMRLPPESLEDRLRGARGRLRAL